MPLKNRTQMVVSLPIDLKKWAIQQAEKECRPLSRFIENLIIEKKKTEENK